VGWLEGGGEGRKEKIRIETLEMKKKEKRRGGGGGGRG